jgi:hypothetical protein
MNLAVLCQASRIDLRRLRASWQPDRLLPDGFRARWEADRGRLGCILSLHAVFSLELQFWHLEELVARRNRGRTSVYILNVLLLLLVLRYELLVHVVGIRVQEEPVAVAWQRFVEAVQLVLGLAELLHHLLLAHSRQEAWRSDW